MVAYSSKPLAQSRLKSKPGVSQPANKHTLPKYAENNRFQAYKKKLPTLIIGLLLLAVLILITRSVYPESIAHILFKNSFLPIISLTFLSSFFLSSYVLLHSRKGLLFATWLTLLIWSQLANALPFWISFPIYTIWFVGLGYLTHKMSETNSINSR